VYLIGSDVLINGQVPEVSKDGSDSDGGGVPPPRGVIKSTNGKRKAVKAEPSPDFESNSQEREDHLPAFALAKWRSVFLPTLCRHMLCSKQPFNGYIKSYAFVAVVQEIVALVWPESNYVVTKKSTIFLNVSLNLCCQYCSPGVLTLVSGVRPAE